MCVLCIFIRNSLHFKGKPELLKIFETYHFCFNLILQKLIAECLAKKKISDNYIKFCFIKSEHQSVLTQQL